jgi:hypothetical protein
VESAGTPLSGLGVVGALHPRRFYDHVPPPVVDANETIGVLGDLREDFDFEQTPLPPMLLPLDAGP